jgi:hypothetical protein
MDYEIADFRHSGVNDTAVQPTFSIYSANTKQYSKDFNPYIRA